MFCRKCGREISNQSVVCIYCGEPVKRNAPIAGNAPVAGSASALGNAPAAGNASALGNAPAAGSVPVQPQALGGRKKIKLNALVALVSNGISVFLGLLTMIFGFVSCSADSWSTGFLEEVAGAKTMGAFLILFGVGLILVNGAAVAFTLFRMKKKK